MRDLGQNMAKPYMIDDFASRPFEVTHLDQPLTYLLIVAKLVVWGFLAVPTPNMWFSLNTDPFL